MDFSCPSCKSENVQRLSVIYQRGLSEINTESRGTAAGYGAGGFGVASGNSKTTGTAQTAASLRAAPPVKKRYLKPIGLIYVVSLVLFMFVSLGFDEGILKTVFA